MNEVEMELRKVLSPRQARRVGKMHDQIANVMSDGFLKCGRCTATLFLTHDLVTNYVCNGWPVCCGATMSYYGPTPVIPEGRA